MIVIATLQTEFATLCFSAAAADPDDLRRRLVIRTVDYAGTLPAGMTVDATACVDVGITAGGPIHDFAFSARLLDMPEQGSPESGEWLDAQSFVRGSGVLMLGTEDGDSLANRLSWFNLNYSTNYPIAYLSDGFEIGFRYVPPDKPLDFHFILAYNASDRRDSSEWFAVDAAQDAVRNASTGRHLRVR